MDIAFSRHILVETTLALDEMVCADMRAYAPDCIVADSMAVWGKAVAKKLGIPFISSTTTFAFNRFSAKVIGQNGAGFLQFLLAQPRINRQLKRLRAASEEEIAATPGIPAEVAHAVFETLRALG